MTTPAGWYPDGQGTLRFWDGAAWTEHTAISAPVPDARTLVPVVAPGQTSTVWQTNLATGALVPAQVAPPLAPNGFGVAGFVVGLVSLFLPLIFGLIGGFAALGLSIVGLTLPLRRRGLAIAGLVLSILAIIFIF